MKTLDVSLFVRSARTNLNSTKNVGGGGVTPKSHVLKDKSEGVHSARESTHLREHKVKHSAPINTLYENS